MRWSFSAALPTLAVPDNTKTAVTRACRYDPDLNPTYQEFAVHYGMGVVPARPYKPRDKAKVESGVQVAERWIVAALRHRKFFSSPELNQAIRELLVRLNQRPFRKRDGSRASLFHSLEKPALAAVAGRALRHEPVVARHRQHRLSRRLRRQLLQRAVHPGAANRGSPLHPDHGRDLSQRQAGGLPPAQSRAR